MRAKNVQEGVGKLHFRELGNWPSFRSKSGFFCASFVVPSKYCVMDRSKKNVESFDWSKSNVETSAYHNVSLIEATLCEVLSPASAVVEMVKANLQKFLADMRVAVFGVPASLIFSRPLKQ